MSKALDFRRWPRRIQLTAGLGLTNGLGWAAYYLLSGKSGLLGAVGVFVVDSIGGSITAAVIVLPIAYFRSVRSRDLASAAVIAGPTGQGLQSASQRVPGPGEARGWRITLGCIGFLGAVAGAVAGLTLLAWLSSFLRRSGADEFPLVALLWLALPAASIGLGVWTWRAKRVWFFASAYAIATGILGLGIAALSVVIGVVLIRLA